VPYPIKNQLLVIDRRLLAGRGRTHTGLDRLHTAQ
jgi:hypothetical protein